MTEANWKELAKDLFEHLEWCGWGDSYEREVSGDLRKRATEAFEDKVDGSKGPTPWTCKCPCHTREKESK